MQDGEEEMGYCEPQAQKRATALARGDGTLTGILEL